MAKPIAFKPKAHDPAADVHQKLAAVPVKHAAAILSLYELLQEAEDHGVLDLLRGSIHAGEHITSKLAEYANTPLGITAVRNLLVISKAIGTIDPKLLNRGINNLAVDLDSEMESRRKHSPSAWQTIKRILSPDALRGLSLMATILASLGKTADSHNDK